MSKLSTLQTVFQSFHNRGCIADTTANIIPGLAKALSSSSSLPPSVYAGFDPTGPSLHLGHAAILLMLKRMQLLGLKPIALIGGATALIGDPSGKREDRPLLSEDMVYQNSLGIKKSICEILEFEENTHAIPVEKNTKGILLNNAEFYKDMSIITFLRTIGRYARISTMLSKDSVKSRLQVSSSTSEPIGLSFTEFSYQLFQAADYAKLYQQHNCILQIGGSDQWGNITTGIDLIKRSLSSSSSSNNQSNTCELTSDIHVHGLTVPLLTTADGKKFGKTEGAPIWLNTNLTSHHNFYQYLLRSEDKDLHKLLNLLTLYTEKEISDILIEHNKQPELKYGQLQLANAVITLFRNKEAMESAQRSARILYAGTALWSIPESSTTGASSTSNLYLPQRALLSDIKVEDILSLCTSKTADTTSNTMSTSTIPYSRLSKTKLHGQPIVDILVSINAVSSKNQGRKLLESGGIYWNWERISAKEGSWISNSLSSTPTSTSSTTTMNPYRTIDIAKDFLNQQVAVISIGKKKMFVIECYNTDT